MMLSLQKKKIRSYVLLNIYDEMESLQNYQDYLSFIEVFFLIFSMGKALFANGLISALRF